MRRAYAAPFITRLNDQSLTNQAYTPEVTVSEGGCVEVLAPGEDLVVAQLEDDRILDGITAAIDAARPL
jgi:hypothetical protein